MKICKRCGIPDSGSKGFLGGVRYGDNLEYCMNYAATISNEQRREENKPIYIGVAIVVGILLLFASCSACVL